MLDTVLDVGNSRKTTTTTTNHKLGSYGTYILMKGGRQILISKIDSMLNGRKCYGRNNETEKDEVDEW